MRSCVLVAVLFLLTSACAVADAPLPEKDGYATGRLFLQTISDGVFSKEEQEQIGAILPRYYGLRIYWHRPSGLFSFRGDYAYATMNGLKELDAYLRQKDALKPERIEFWPKPTPEVRQASDKRASEAIRRISERIIALKGAGYHELDGFQVESIRLTDTGFWYAPNKPERYMKIARPVIGIGIGPPCLVTTQTPPTRVILPKQRLEVSRTLQVDSAPLREKVTEIVQTEIAPLIAAERSLGGEPIFEGWYCLPDLSDLGKPVDPLTP